MAEQKVESGRIADGAILGNKIASNAVRGNNIVAGTITGNLLASQTITGDDLATNIIRANNIVAASIGSNTLTPNLSLSLIRVFETANVYATPVSGNVNIDVLNNTVYFFSSNTTGNVTLNFRANTQNTLDSQLGLGQSVTAAILLKQGSIKYRANVYVDNVLQTVWWLGNSAPGYATSQQESIDTYAFNILKTTANTYTILGSNSNFALAQGQIS